MQTATVFSYCKVSPHSDRQWTSHCEDHNFQKSKAGQGHDELGSEWALMKNWRQGQPLQLDSFAKAAVINQHTEAAAPAALDLHFPRNTFPTQNASKRCLSRKITSMPATFWQRWASLGRQKQSSCSQNGISGTSCKLLSETIFIQFLLETLEYKHMIRTTAET